MPDYLPAGYCYPYDTDLTDFDDESRPTPLVKCSSCGALVNGGGQSRKIHDQFHEALAQLFDQVYSE